MKIRHEAVLTVPYEATAAVWVDVISALHDVPGDAKVSIEKTKRDYDQRDGSSWGGETVIRASWET